jgi:hypothetical protein
MLATFWMTKTLYVVVAILTGWSILIQSLHVIWTVFISNHVTDHKFLEYVHEDSLQISRQKSRFVCNSLDEPLKASEHPVVSRSFSIEDVQTLGQHRPDARSSFSNFYTELDFSRDYLGSFYKTSRRCGNTSRRYPAFQNVSSFFFERKKELQRRLSRRVPVMGRITLFWKAVTEDRSDEANFHPNAPQPEFEFEQI